jgi:hypothetical protein
MVTLGRARLVFATLALACAGAGSAEARSLRPIFEPTDLEMEETGVVELDLQFGGIRSRGPWRVVVPDFELDIGLLPYLELDLDGAYAVEGPSSGPFAFDHAAPDSLWPCLKLGLLDTYDEDSHRALAVGWQVGPKLPTAAGSHGIGVESLVLLGLAVGSVHTALNAGVFADPAPDATSGRPVGFEVGLDLELELAEGGPFSLLGELSGVRFWSDDPAQLLATAGGKWAATPWLDISLIGLWGFLDGSDRYGVLVGFSPKVRLFAARPKG